MKKIITVEKFNCVWNVDVDKFEFGYGYSKGKSTIEDIIAIMDEIGFDETYCDRCCFSFVKRTD